MTRCRGAVDDCYSVTSRYRGGNRQGGYCSRADGQKKMVWRRKTPVKKVSFANPLVSFMGPPTKEQRILHLLKEAPGWTHVQSPRGEDMTAQKNLMDADMANTAKSQRVPRPFTKHTMEAWQVLVEQGNKSKGRKKSKVAPSPTVEQPATVG
ncbi:unnamed protein product [Urochloa humidicola]